jgi:ferric-dicitrate binding protein FerR (iron transport regulator)
VDAELALAWKNGFFLFSSERLDSIMDKVARWYNVEVTYADASLKSKRYTGTLDRSDNISGVIELLEQTEGVKLKVSGKQITVEKTNK